MPGLFTHRARRSAPLRGEGCSRRCPRPRNRSVLLRSFFAPALSQTDTVAATLRGLLRDQWRSSITVSSKLVSEFLSTAMPLQHHGDALVDILLGMTGWPSHAPGMRETVTQATCVSSSSSMETDASRTATATSWAARGSAFS